MTQDDFAWIQRLQGQITMQSIILAEIINLRGGVDLDQVRQRVQSIAVQGDGPNDPANQGMSEAKDKFLKFLH